MICAERLKASRVEVSTEPGFNKIRSKASALCTQCVAKAHVLYEGPSSLWIGAIRVGIFLRDVTGISKTVLSCLADSLVVKGAGDITLVLEFSIGFSAVASVYVKI